MQEEDKEFLLNNEVEILKAIQNKKREQKEAKLKAQIIKNDILNQVNKER